MLKNKFSVIKINRYVMNIKQELKEFNRRVINKNTTTELE